ncbi:MULTISPECIES: AzlC family ABC transporter permease [Carboxydocella]|uniref:4-azaleucine resistance probable transporter AzlC n=2 Tax=Carboxydocella TaxID=178898 RepID=A0A1T4MVJ2_9FIRM|nr:MULTISPECIES: AzlC family ABC transporter permease [Carboxydocella]AVX20309.1 4-azaleucine resistance probable transporter AzlC [Carboxydocella thermautotrophica]AVX30733.1 4-azaleucine resistance probable transporter AzlC [Carboxydocella thermautotrophica]SJZ71022.1 4-azaleucine resistance probable transporter AzlC [Carboxydocella sporoproducens DSM 16521]GAW30120.1 autotransporter [Carboxydocella sp. ULO1]GAW31138.1 autotransporter [Carboxydocella sp. JDF658]
MKANLLTWRAGCKAGLAIAVGYFPVAMAFGLMAKAINVSGLEATLFSLLVFAGASQFMALNLIKAGVFSGEIILATLLLNFRHFLMSAALSTRLEDRRFWRLALVAFGITDETFALAMTREGKLNFSFLLGLEGTAYLAWVLGTVTGYLLGDGLPPAWQNSLAIGLYAMFAAILVPEGKKSARLLMVAALAGLINTGLSYLGRLPGGWNLIIAMVAAAAFALVMERGREEERCRATTSG